MSAIFIALTWLPTIEGLSYLTERKRNLTRGYLTKNLGEPPYDIKLGVALHRAVAPLRL